MAQYENGITAKKRVIELVKKGFFSKSNDHVSRWLDETYQVFCLIKCNRSSKKEICVALLHKIDFDPLGIHSPPPMLLDYIQTSSKYQKMGFAQELIRKLVKNNKIIAFCANDASSQLFTKCGFSYHPDNNWMVRFPPLVNDSPKLIGTSLSPPKDDPLASVRRNMEKISDESDILYANCGDECDVLSPTMWLFNQDQMRKMWEEFKIKTETLHENPSMRIYSNTILNNSCAKYMEFMYQNYPPGFGREMEKSYSDGVTSDGAKTFLNLINTHDL